MTAAGPGKAPGYLPEPEGLHAEFFALAAATGRLHLQRCEACATFRHPPRRYCPACFSPEWTNVAVSGRGQVHSAVVAHRVFGPAPTPDLPYVTVVVELDEGPRVVGVARDGQASEWTLGRRVRIDVEPSGESFAFFAVRLDDP